MSFPIATTTATTLKMVRAHYLVGFLAAVVGIVAVVSIGVWQDREPSNSGPSVPRALPATTWRSYEPVITYFLVDCEEQAELVRQGELEAGRELWSSGIEPSGANVILLADTPENAANAFGLFVESYSGAKAAPGEVNSELVDLRGR
jgi:hypothetical protein